MTAPCSPPFRISCETLKKSLNIPKEGRALAISYFLSAKLNKQQLNWTFALNFRTLAAQMNWVEDTLKLLFRRGLTLELQAELACQDQGSSLNAFIELAIHIDNLLRTRCPVRQSASASPALEPMQLGYTPLLPEERERRWQLDLCTSPIPCWQWRR